MYPDEHCDKVVEILQSEHYDDGFIRSVRSHGYGMRVDIKPEHEMEKVLYAIDELTGLIGAAALMRPSKSISDMELKSLKKKFNDKIFAAKCSRDVIRNGAEMLGWELDKLLSMTLEAMRAAESNITAQLAEIYL
jgi:predicted hydrolase (HD superfamily)